MNHSSQTSRWRALSKIATNLASSSKQFLADEDRYDQFSFEASGILLDLSKQKITREILQELLSLANEKDLANKIEALFREGTLILLRIDPPSIRFYEIRTGMMNEPNKLGATSKELSRA